MAPGHGTACSPSDPTNATKTKEKDRIRKVAKVGEKEKAKKKNDQKKVANSSTTERGERVNSPK